MVRKWSTGLLDTTGGRLRTRRGGAEEKPELRRRGDGIVRAAS
jgi:hypothetical protein